MRRLPALVVALLLPASQPLVLGTALSTAALLVSQAPAQAQSQEAAANNNVFIERLNYNIDIIRPKPKELMLSISACESTDIVSLEESIVALPSELVNLSFTWIPCSFLRYAILE